MRTTDAPLAIGRSGNRVERGVSTSGLLGERLMKGDDPKRSTHVQRSWLYHDDPALHYKIHGKPSAEPVLDRSLILPSERGVGGMPAIGADNRRRMILTGDLSTNSGKMRAGVFLDEFELK